MRLSWRSELVAPMSGLAWSVGAGSLLRIVDVEGGQSGDVFAVAADDLTDGQSNGRTFDYGGTVRLSTGSVLYSRRSRPLVRIVEDEVGTHDFLYAPCSQEMFEIQYGVTGPHPNCFDNLAQPLAGSLDIQAPVSTAGQGLTFVAERDVLVAVTACPAPACNGGSGARPLRVEIATPAT
ncbi:MAG: urea carboxylase-associated family protein [Chloroflexi bacterium]|nr:MAG: urea carboxylase-associated family protein [Chloroflexota bacterium]